MAGPTAATYGFAVVGGATVACAIVYAGNYGPLVQSIAAALPSGPLLVLIEHHSTPAEAYRRLRTIAKVEFGLMLAVLSAAAVMDHELPAVMAGSALLAVYLIGVGATVQSTP